MILFDIQIVLQEVDLSVSKCIKQENSQKMAMGGHFSIIKYHLFIIWVIHNYYII